MRSASRAGRDADAMAVPATGGWAAAGRTAGSRRLTLRDPQRWSQRYRATGLACQTQAGIGSTGRAGWSWCASTARPLPPTGWSWSLAGGTPSTCQGDSPVARGDGGEVGVVQVGAVGDDPGRLHLQLDE